MEQELIYVGIDVSKDQIELRFVLREQLGACPTAKRKSMIWLPN